MQIKKAVITAAGRGAWLYPAADTVQKSMFPIVDLDGLVKPAIQIIAEEALESGIEEVCIVCAPGDEEQYRCLFSQLRDNLLAESTGGDQAIKQADRIDFLLNHIRYAVQEESLGYGHAVYCAHQVIGEEPFLLLLGDHLFISNQKDKRCARQLLELAKVESCPIAAVQATREHLVGFYGTLSGKRIPHFPGLYQIERILEKPSLSLAELELHTTGLRAGFYLCLFGQHVLSPQIFTILREEMEKNQDGGKSLPLTPALQCLADQEKFLALEVQGTRHDIGTRYGLLRSQIAMGLAGKDKDEVLGLMVESLAEANQRAAGRDSHA